MMAHQIIKYLFTCILILFLGNLFSQEHSNHFSFKEAAVILPSPADVQLDPGGRFYARYQGNQKYLKHQYEHYGKFMAEVFAARQYSPGKLLERMWDGEYAGKWLDAATRTAVNTDDKDLLQKVDDFALALMKYQQKDGYMGVQLPTDRELNGWEEDWDLWNQWTCMIGFMTHYEFRGNKASLNAASAIGQWIVENKGPIKDKDAPFLNSEISGGFTRVVNIGQLVRLYNHTGNKEFLNFVGQVIEHHQPIQQMLKTNEPILLHPYMLNATLMGMLAYSVAKKDVEMLTTLENVWDELVDTHMFPTGSLGESEDLYEGPLKDVPGGQLQETCATSEWIFFTQMLYSVTGKEKYIEVLELTTYNALIGAQSADGLRWCYWTPLRYSKDWFHGPTRCCFWSGPRGIARIPQLIYAQKNDIVYVNLYESSHASLKTDKGEIKIGQQSNFPQKGSSKIEITSEEGWRGTLRLRIPGWTSEFKIILNGSEVPLKNVDGYCDVVLKGKNEYSLEIQFDIPLVLDQMAEKDYAILRGPEVLAIDLRDNIDTWLGQNNLVSLPEDIKIENTNSFAKYQWPGPASVDDNRRRYRIKVEDQRTSEQRDVIWTPYADAGNDGAAFRTIFPLHSEDD
jgi:DUF1680 family protein